MAERTQTFLFTDIEGSTRLWNRAPAAMADAVPAQEALLRRVVEDAEVAKASLEFDRGAFVFRQVELVGKSVAAAVDDLLQ